MQGSGKDAFCSAEKCKVGKVETKSGLKCSKKCENRESSAAEPWKQRHRMRERTDQRGFEKERRSLARRDVGPGPNQSDTFEILNSFPVNQASPFTAAWSR